MSLLDPVYLMCDSAAIDAAGKCANAVWVAMPVLIPQFSLASGAIVGGAIFTLWGGAYFIKSLRGVGDD